MTADDYAALLAALTRGDTAAPAPDAPPPDERPRPAPPTMRSEAAAIPFKPWRRGGNRRAVLALLKRIVAAQHTPRGR